MTAGHDKAGAHAWCAPAASLRIAIGAAIWLPGCLAWAGYTNTATPTPLTTPTFTSTATITPTRTPTPTPRQLTIRVPQDFSSIQAAIDNAVNGDEIIVSPGVYRENIHTRGKYLNLHGSNTRSWYTIANTIIDGGSQGSVITLAGTEWIRPYDQPITNYLTIAGFTICHGSAENGGGINGNGGGLWLESCIIRDNHAARDGGGIYDIWGEFKYLQIIRNVAGEMGGGLRDRGRRHSHIGGLIHSNRARFGGGIAFTETRPGTNIYPGGCVITNNQAEVDGGGTYEVMLFAVCII
ncbi:hypothetical protein HS125_10560 [bacterium]|nr:hypothetical protein [bacterium]